MNRYPTSLSHSNLHDPEYYQESCRETITKELRICQLNKQQSRRAKPESTEVKMESKQGKKKKKRKKEKFSRRAASYYMAHLLSMQEMIRAFPKGQAESTTTFRQFVSLAAIVHIQIPIRMLLSSIFRNDT